MQDLAFILFLPLYVVLGAVFWLLPLQPRGRARRWFDVTSMILAMAAGFVGGRWAYTYADWTLDSMWPQMLAALVSYGLFVLVLLIALPLRARVLRESARSAGNTSNSL
jgi:hypothetical protein